MIGLGIYVLGFFLSYRYTYLALAKSDFFGTAEDKEGRVFTALMSAIINVVWPAVILFVLVYKFATPVSPAEKRVELDRREREIDARERELKVGPYKNER